jgi:hypothetical protein
VHKKCVTKSVGTLFAIVGSKNGPNYHPDSEKINENVNFSTPSNTVLKISIYFYSVFNQKIPQFFYESHFLVKSRLKRLLPYQQFRNLICQRFFSAFAGKFLDTFLKQSKIKLQQQKISNLRNRNFQREKRNRKALKMNLP